MSNIEPVLLALAGALAFGLLGWVVSLAKKDVSIVDGMWSLMFVVSALVYIGQAGAAGPRAWLVLVLLVIWAVRLSGYITWRNWGEQEDYRYQQIRKNNSPNFAFKSLYIVFGLQALLAWFVSLPVLAASSDSAPLAWLDVLGVALWLVGFVFESVGDFQLARFRANPSNQGKVMQSGLWRYTRHPNYFGDFCVWWGFYLIALSAGAWWTLLSPLLMSFLLLKVSGVAMLEKTITSRRPGYAEYIAATNAFFPGPRKRSGH
jgi:steroid 5-alpha reductase family enzyme